jgi:hypothetical protein
MMSVPSGKGFGADRPNLRAIGRLPKVFVTRSEASALSDCDGRVQRCQSLGVRALLQPLRGSVVAP